MDQGTGEKMQQVEKLLEARDGDGCLLCGRDPAVIGLFWPRDSAAFGAPSGKGRIFRYCLCDRCIEIEEGQRTERIEKVIRFQVSNNEGIRQLHD